MTDTLQTALSIAGAIGGLIGVWAAVATVRRDRPRITLELGFCRATSPTPPFVQVIPAAPEEGAAYYLTVKVRNVGQRPAFLEEVRLEYRRGSEPLFDISSRCEVVLEETRRSHSVYFNLDNNLEDRPDRLTIVDHRGIRHSASLNASRIARRIYGTFPRLLVGRTRERLAIVTALQEYFDDPNRDPFDTRIERERVGDVRNRRLTSR